MYAEPSRQPVPSRKGCSPRTCSCLPLVSVLLFAFAITGYLQYREIRLVTSGRQPVVAAQPKPNLPSPERYLCREVRPQLTALAHRLVAASDSPAASGRVSGSPLEVWVLLLDRTHATDWLVAANPQRGYMWLSINDIVDPQAFWSFIASTAVFRNCPPGTFTELRAAVPPRLGVPDVTPSADTDTASASDDSTSAAVGWNGTVNVASNLRTGPGTDFPVLGVLATGVEVFVVGVSEDQEWLELDDGNWIYRSLITRTDDGLASASGASEAERAGAEPSVESGPAGKELPGSGSDSETLAKLRLYMLDLINSERSSRGLEAVVLADNEGSQFHAEDLVENRYLSHWNLRGETPYMRHTRAGGHDYSAENVSYTVDFDPPPDGFCVPLVSQQYLDLAMAALMDSPGHRDNLLRPLHREVNIGIARDCFGIALVQVFEGEYVRFSQTPQLEDGRLVMAGQVAPDVELNDQASIMVVWDPPLTAYTRDQVFQTGCYSLGRPTARVHRSLPAGWTRQAKQEVVWEHCPAPWDADPNLRLPANRAEIEQLHQRIRDGYRIQTTVEVAVVTAEVWQVAEANFRIEADLRSVIQTHGPGIYSMVLQGVIQGWPEALTTYSIVVNG